MKKIKQIISLLLSLVILNSIFMVQSSGASSITGISLQVSTDLVAWREKGEETVNITSSHPNYTITNYQFLNDVTTWTNSDIPRLQIDLTANEGYAFSNHMTTNDVSLFNTSATVQALNRQGTEMVSVILLFKPLSETVGTPVDLKWTSDGKATWKWSSAASGYDLRLYRGGTLIWETYNTPQTSYDLAVKMLKPGSYTFWVRSRHLSNATIKSDFAVSAKMEVDIELGHALKNRIIGWKEDVSGWWYRNSDGSYAVNGWKLIDEKYYYFDEKGYLMVDTTTPDGYLVDAEGAWIVSP